jgi:hypothetical protein
MERVSVGWHTQALRLDLREYNIFRACKLCRPILGSTAFGSQVVLSVDSKGSVDSSNGSR